MESTDQVLEQSNTDQPNEVESDQAEQSQSSNGNTQDDFISKDEYKRLQAEYTKSRQELSKLKKDSELSDEDKQAIDFIKKHWFITKEELDNMSMKQSQELNLREILDSNPDLRSYEQAIRDLWKTTWMAYEDIIQKYWFKSKDKLLKARWQWEIKWMPEKSEKSIAEMSIDEYEAYKKKKWWSDYKWTFA